MVHDFGSIPSPSIPRSQFRMPSTYKATFDVDKLIPIYVQEVLPGDSANIRLNAFGRVATLIYPLLDNLRMDFHWFEVPMRLVWENSKKFFGEQDNPGDSIDFTIPQVVAPAGGHAEGSLWDYFGLPIGTKGALMTQNALPSRCYNLIYNHWFRNELLINSAVVDTDNGPDTYTDYVLRKRAKRPDYFTSSLPSPQKGDSVSLPLGTRAPVTGIGMADATYNSTSVNAIETNDPSAETYATAKDSTGATANDRIYIEQDGVTGQPNIWADLSTATAATITQLRLAMMTQAFLEKDMRSGTRYSELCLAHFGTANDSRAYRPVYLGGGSIPIAVHPVANQTATSGSDALGDLGANASFMTSGQIGLNRSFIEHGYIFCICSVRADLTYSQGIDRMWSRSTRYDFFWPLLQSLSEQAVLNKEIYMDMAGSPDDVFGYQERFSEYKFKTSKICGAFRSNAATPLDAWHLSEEFASQPSLNQTFIESTTPMARVEAVSSEPDILFDAYFDAVMARPMKLHSVPGLVGRF